MNQLMGCWALMSALDKGTKHDCTGCNMSKDVLAVYDEPHSAIVKLKDGTERRFGPFSNYGAAESAGHRKMFELEARSATVVHEKETS
jgi:hypothetical protein